MLAEKELSVYIERKRIKHKKSNNELIYATDSIITFFFGPHYIHILLFGIR